MQSKFMTALMSIRAQFELNTYNYYKKIKQISIKFLKQY